MKTWKHCRQGLNNPTEEYRYDSDFFSFYKGKKVLVTGITGFKGSWMLKVLSTAGADVLGYALDPPTEPSLFRLLEGEKLCRYVRGDVRDYELLSRTFAEFQPEIVLHLAAQPIVRESYRDPVGTFETNVMGTVKVLDCVRKTPSVRSFLNVTTDKVYENNEWLWGYREDEKLDGFDPYSNSKSCSELSTHCYRNSFFSGKDGSSPAVSTARAGNVIGGGDFAKDRIIPDCVRAVAKGTEIVVRNPYSTRPYEHVLEPVFAYLMICRESYLHPEKAGYYNVGPDDTDCLKTGDIVDAFCDDWGDNAGWINVAEENAPHEASFLKLDNSKIKSVFGWKPTWNVEKAIEKTVEWSKIYLSGGSVSAAMEKQIKEFCGNV